MQVFLKCFHSQLFVLQTDCDMCTGYKCVVRTASCLGLIQSIVWTGLSIAGGLLYLDVITVEPYLEPKDFFRVSLVKLYFEGPKSNISGSYLGKFAEDYRNPNVIDLFWPDKVFAVMVAYVIINVPYFFISILLYSNNKPKKLNENKRFLDIALGWSLYTFLLCAIDVTFGYFLFRDFLQIKDYVNKSPCDSPSHDISLRCNQLSDLPYVPLIMSLVSERLIFLWLWNFVIACLFFSGALFSKTMLTKPNQPEQKREQEQKVTVLPKPPQVLPPVKLINKSYSTTYDITKDCDSIDVKRSVEAVTSFSDNYGKPQGRRIYSRRDWNYAPSDSSLQNSLWHPKLDFKEWNAINEGYESDENGSVVLERIPNPDQKEESGQTKIKIMKPPIGKRVEDAENKSIGRAGSLQ